MEKPDKNLRNPLETFRGISGTKLSTLLNRRSRVSDANARPHR